MIVKHVNLIMKVPLFVFCMYSREVVNSSPDLTKTLMLAFSQTPFKGNITILHDYNLAGVYQSVPGLMTLTLFQGHMSVRSVNCKLYLEIDCQV